VQDEIDKINSEQEELKTDPIVSQMFADGSDGDGSAEE
jgi:hypothetical protein